MKSFIFFLTITVITFQSCQSGEKKKAFDLNQKLTPISDSLSKKGQALAEVLKSSVSSHDFSKIDPICKDIQQFLDRNITVVTATENVGGSEKFKNAILDFLKFEKELVIEGVVPFATMNDTTPQTDIQSAIQNLLEKSKNENTYLVTVKAAQKDYAAKNGFEIKKKE